jgi:FtsH-binding integral membrane protein
MTPPPLDLEDRKTFNRWATAVTIIYGLLTVGLAASGVYSVWTATVESASRPIGDVASDRSAAGEPHR